MATAPKVALATAAVALGVTGLACASSADTTTDASTVASTTTTAGGAGPAVRVTTNEPGDLARLFAAWAIGAGGDGYVGPCAEEPSTMAPADTWCSVEVAPADDGQVFVLFHPGASSPSAAVLVAPSDGYFRIDDSHLVGDGAAPAWFGSTG